MLGRGAISALVVAISCLLNTSKAFVTAPTMTSSSSNNNKWTKKNDAPSKAPVGSSTGFGLGQTLPQVRGFGAGSAANLPRVPSAKDYAERKSRGDACPPLELMGPFGVIREIAGAIERLNEIGTFGGGMPTTPGTVITIYDSKMKVTKEIVVQATPEGEVVEMEVVEGEEDEDDLDGMLSWALRRKRPVLKTTETAAALDSAGAAASVMAANEGLIAKPTVEIATLTKGEVEKGESEVMEVVSEEVEKENVQAAVEGGEREEGKVEGVDERVEKEDVGVEERVVEMVEKEEVEVVVQGEKREVAEGKKGLLSWVKRRVLRRAGSDAAAPVAAPAAVPEKEWHLLGQVASEGRLDGGSEHYPLKVLLEEGVEHKVFQDPSNRREWSKGAYRGGSGSTTSATQSTSSSAEKSSSKKGDAAAPSEESLARPAGCMLSDIVLLLAGSYHAT
eukprot:jgi/Undpi1/1817/HiC_scaffold_12.g05204.m1